LTGLKDHIKALQQLAANIAREDYFVELSWLELKLAAEKPVSAHDGHTEILQH